MNITGRMLAWRTLALVAVACIPIALVLTHTPYSAASGTGRSEFRDWVSLCDAESLVAECVMVTDSGERIMVTREPTGEITVIAFRACTAEDGPAPCIWDSLRQGDGFAGPGVDRFVIVR